MYAAVVSSFTTPPRYECLPAPVPRSAHEVTVEVMAAGLHPRVRSQAAGSHYTSTAELPLVPGIDGVGRTADGTVRYFLLPDTTRGSMAERTVVDLRRSVVLPEGCDPIAVAAAMNPAMSSWVALRRRVDISPGARVLVLGATGSAGRLAIPIARHLGAVQVIAAGRDADRLAELPALGADATVSLAGPPDDVADRLGRAAAGVDVVLDYVWGATAAAAMAAVVTARPDRGRPLTWVQIGAVAGPTAAVPAAALRAARLQIMGSGQGSVPTEDILAGIAELAPLISRGAFPLAVRTVPLAEVEATWAAPAGGSERLVFTPR